MLTKQDIFDLVEEEDVKILIRHAIYGYAWNNA